MMDAQLHEWALRLSVIAFVYSYILTRPGAFLSGLYKFIERLADKRKSDCDEPDIAWWFNPLIGCENCVAGQLALWLYPTVIFPVWLNWAGYDLIQHLFFICELILIVSIIKHGYLWLTKMGGS